MDKNAKIIMVFITVYQKRTKIRTFVRFFEINLLAE